MRHTLTDKRDFSKNQALSHRYASNVTSFIKRWRWTTWSLWEAFVLLLFSWFLLPTKDKPDSTPNFYFCFLSVKPNFPHWQFSSKIWMRWSVLVPNLHLHELRAGASHSESPARPRSHLWPGGNPTQRLRPPLLTRRQGYQGLGAGEGGSESQLCLLWTKYKC